MQKKASFACLKTFIRTSCCNSHKSLLMAFGLFKKKTEKEKLIEKHRRLLEEAFKLSKVNRRQSEEKVAEAEELMKKIETLPD